MRMSHRWPQFQTGQTARAIQKITSAKDHAEESLRGRGGHHIWDHLPRTSSKLGQPNLQFSRQRTTTGAGKSRHRLPIHLNLQTKCNRRIDIGIWLHGKHRLVSTICRQCRIHVDTITPGTGKRSNNDETVHVRKKKLAQTFNPH